MSIQTPTQVFDNFTTERLTVRDWSDALANSAAHGRLVDALVSILTPDVLTFLPPSLQVAQNQQAVSAWIEECSAQSDVFLITQAHSKALIGLIFVATMNDAEAGKTCHIGYLLSRVSWGQG